jgi:hypothetical protein
VLDRDRVVEALLAACADAGIAPATVVTFVVPAPRPEGTTPLAYLHPGGTVRPDTVSVFRAVGAERAALGGRPAHRLALWGELPGIPPCALAPMLRHELEHARRFERSGPRFFEADDLLRAALRSSGGDGYGALPSEREANAASAAYAARVLTAAELRELDTCGECRGLLAAGVPPADVVGETLSALAARADWAPRLAPAARRAYLAELREACAAWDPDDRPLVAAAGPQVELV